jgi:hypothetical protein
MSTTTNKIKVIRGDNLKVFCENYKRPIGADGKLIKCKDYTKNNSAISEDTVIIIIDHNLKSKH